MANLKRYGKIILFDTLATICFIGVILFGWLPGPGGLPLFLAGLALLAVNHDWAERWLETAKHRGRTFKKILFPDNQFVRYSYDILSTVLFIAASYSFFTTDNRLIAGFSTAAAAFAFFVLLLNRDRLGKLSTLFKRKPK